MRQSRLSGSVEGVMSNHDSYSDSSEPWSLERFQVYSPVRSRHGYLISPSPFTLLANSINDGHSSRS
jgi:hypothetical protein